ECYTCDGYTDDCSDNINTFQKTGCHGDCYKTTLSFYTNVSVATFRSCKEELCTPINHNGRLCINMTEREGLKIYKVSGRTTPYRNNGCIYNCMKGQVVMQVKYPILGWGNEYKFNLQHDKARECREYSFTLSNQPHLHDFKLTFYFALEKDNIGLTNVHYDFQLTDSHEKKRVPLSSKAFLKVVKDHITHYECNKTISEVNTFDYGTFTKIKVSIIIYETFYGLSTDRKHKDVVHCDNGFRLISRLIFFRVQATAYFSWSYK
ncbi:hypothetical protein A3Q56_07413, partial [Intoshia linei]